MHITTESKIRYWLILFFKGALMGVADLVPGVSGGTIAFISGIYEELIESIASINLKSIKTLKNEGFYKFWCTINGSFILTIICGALFSIISFSRIVNYLLIEERILVWSFFFGLILASALHMLKQLSCLRLKELLSIVVGIAAISLISIAPTATSSEGFFILFFGGSLAVCAMILPGISGSFILLLLGIYPIIIAAIGEFQWNILLIFSLGCVFGLLTFSRILIALLRKYHSIFISTLIGFLLGSLTIVWPWKNTASSNISNADFEFIFSHQLLFPGEYTFLTEQDPLTYVAVSLMIAGFLVVFSIDFLAKRLTNKR